MKDRVTVVFVMAYACPLKCNFCCHPREVVGSKRIARATLVKWMTQFAPEPTVTRFCFTGGEPFLYLEDIKAAVAEARAAGVTQPFHIVTAAQWAESRERVMSIMSELRDLGMDLLGVSYDHEHAKWVRQEQIKWVIEVAAELGIRIDLHGVFWNVGESIADLMPTDNLPGEVNATSYLAAPTGRAKTASTWPRKYDLPNELKYTCGRSGKYDITLYPDGEAYPCCSGGFNIEGKLSCGNMNQHSTGEILRAAFTKFHVRMVKEFGWGILYSFIQKNSPELYKKLPRFEDVDSVCEVCQQLNANLAEELRPMYAAIEVEYARARAEVEWKELDERVGPASARNLGAHVVSFDDLGKVFKENPDLRLDYISGAAQLAASNRVHSVEARI